MVSHCESVVFDPADGDFLRLFVAGFAVELEQPQIIALRAFLFGRCGQVCSELREQAAERFQMLELSTHESVLFLQ